MRSQEIFQLDLRVKLLECIGITSLSEYLFIIVPSQAPTSFNVTAQTSTSVTASWQPPPADARNGNITGFKLFYTQKGVTTKCPTILTINSSANPVTNVSELKKYREYEFHVLAFTSIGDGPKSVAKVLRTKEDGKRLKAYFH